jgi:two-component system response regulator DevR
MRLREGGMEKRILLVEDNARFREDFARALERALAAESLDAALIDVRLPDGDGLDLVRELHNGDAGAHIPTLVLTAYLDHRVAAQAMDAGAKGALSKVVSVPETVEAIKRLTGSGR